MKVLVIGGRGFLGRAIVDALKAEQHLVTLLNRGLTHTSVHADVEWLCGDRKKDFHLFNSRSWDVVIDTCGYHPHDVAELARALAPRVGHYIFISSVSVYGLADLSNKQVQQDEKSTPITDLSIDLHNGGVETYGARKFLCEQQVSHYFDGRYTCVRPGLIVGPHDSFYRFTYWVDRIAEGGSILAPGQPTDPLQFIDVRDLGEWVARLVRSKPLGAFNAVRPTMPIGEFFAQARDALKSDAHFIWASEEFLRSRQVACWVQLPLWVYREHQNFMTHSSASAQAMGLRFRTLCETVTATHKWSLQAAATPARAVTLSRAEEGELLRYHLTAGQETTMAT